MFWSISDKLLKEQRLNQGLSDVDVLKRFLLEDDLRFLEVDAWFDIGTVEKINAAREYFNVVDFHVLDKTTESIFRMDDGVIKFFYDQEICKNRVERTRHLEESFLKFLIRPNFYKYEYAQGQLFSKVANHQNIR